MSSEAVVLRQAADLIRRHGWIQRKFGSDEEGHCLIGALIKVEPERVTHLNWILAQELGVLSVVSWNDQEGRTQGEVLELLESVASKLSEEDQDGPETL